jgi:hypothetical protein
MHSNRMHMFQQNREMLIVIILEDMSIHRMPARLQQIWESITCLEADDIVRGCSLVVISDVGFYNVYKVF